MYLQGHLPLERRKKNLLSKRKISGFASQDQKVEYSGRKYRNFKKNLRRALRIPIKF